MPSSDSYDPSTMLMFIRSVFVPLPGGREGVCYGTPCFYAHKKLVCRMREDGDTLVLYQDDRDTLMQEDPEVFYVTDHYLNSSYVLVRLPLIDLAKLKSILLDTWKSRASKTHLKAYEDS